MIADHFLISRSKRPRLRIGLLLDGLSLPSCFEQVIDHIQKSNFAKIEFVMMHVPANPPPAQPTRSRRSRWNVLRGLLSDPKRRPKLGFAIYQKLDQKLCLRVNDPLAPVDCTDRLSRVESIKITPLVKGFVHRFDPSDIEQIRKRNLDVILRFGFNILKGDVLTVARYGVWSYHHGDNDYYRGGPPYFWELYEKNKLSGVILQILTEELDAGYVLAKANFSTVQGSLSTIQNRFTAYWGSTHLVIQKLWQLHNFGWEHVEKLSIPNKPYRGMRKIYRTPNNWELLKWLVPSSASKAGRWLARVARPGKIAFWRLALRLRSPKLLYQTGYSDRSAFRWLTPPRGHFHADPFLVEHERRTWMFFEDYVYAESKAAIVCREVLPDGELGEMRTVLNRPYHLSYPFVFKHDDDYYLIPESASNGTVELYRATDFPHKWVLEKVLYHGKAVDTTVHFENETFWFFSTLRAAAGEGMFLCLFYSDRIDGDWQWHPCNPISMDVRDARCGGRLFRHNEKLMRVSQDCSGRYGSSFSFREITTLTKTDYQENLLQTVEPWSKSFSGTHTYDHCSGIEVIDGVTFAPKSIHMVPVELPPENP
jgi:hypothetical protein